MIPEVERHGCEGSTEQPGEARPAGEGSTRAGGGGKDLVVGTAPRMTKIIALGFSKGIL